MVDSVGALGDNFDKNSYKLILPPLLKLPNDGSSPIQSKIMKKIVDIGIMYLRLYLV